MVATLSPARAATTVSTCGRVVAGDAALNGDLDCTGIEDYAVQVQRGTLALNGFTIRGGWGVQCNGPCKVVGPGTITESPYFGINAYQSTLQVSNVILTSNGWDAIQCAGTCRVDGTAISGNGGGIRSAGTLKARSTTIVDNTFEAINASNSAGTARVILEQVTITGNHTGILTQRGAKLTDTTVADNGISGIDGGWLGCHVKSGIQLTRSTVTGNTSDPTCGVSRVCFDLATCAAPPRLKQGSTCEHSYVVESGAPGSDWGVCTLD